MKQTYPINHFCKKCSFENIVEKRDCIIVSYEDIEGEYHKKREEGSYKCPNCNSKQVLWDISKKVVDKKTKSKLSWKFNKNVCGTTEEVSNGKN